MMLYVVWFCCALLAAQEPLGWKYLEAHDKEQKYKEGAFVVSFGCAISFGIAFAFNCFSPLLSC